MAWQVSTVCARKKYFYATSFNAPLLKRWLFISRYVLGATAAEYAANLRKVYTVHTIQVLNVSYSNAKVQAEVSGNLSCQIFVVKFTA